MEKGYLSNEFPATASMFNITPCQDEVGPDLRHADEIKRQHEADFRAKVQELQGNYRNVISRSGTSAL